jgi:hypothetical protein
VTCELLNLGPGDVGHRTVLVETLVTGNVPVSTVLQASASASSSSTPDCEPSNSIDVPVTATVEAVADVYIGLVDIPAADVLDTPFEPDYAVQGEEHRYAVTFGNIGPSIAESIAIQLFLDYVQFGVLGETFLRCEPFDIDDFVACSENNGVVDVDLLLRTNQQIVPGDLAPGEQYGFYLITEVVPDYVEQAAGVDYCQNPPYNLPGPCLTTDSRVTTSTTDLTTLNNVDAHDTVILSELPEQADLVVELSTEAVSVLPGDSLVYQLDAINGSAENAEDVEVTQWLPDEVDLVDIVEGPEPMVCDEAPDGESLSCTLFTIPSGQERNLTVEVLVDPATPLDTVLRSTAHVTAVTPDGNSMNNQTVHQIAVTPLIFSDGFETGDTSSWSSATP